jgi:oligopeptide transport system ATP-binding protein
MGLILITHDLGDVAEVADRIAVMYAGRIVEHTDAATLYAQPGHPYTRGLMDSVPRVDGVGLGGAAGATLRPIPGLPPSLSAIPNGCPFHPRCAYAQDVCTDEVPPLRELGSDHQAACHFAERFVAEGPDRPSTQEVVSG